MGKGIFITGTGTEVGKTYVAGLLVKKLSRNGLNPGYYKAAMSGNDTAEDGSLIPGDAKAVKTMSGTMQPLEDMCPYVYKRAVSPHLAARIEGGLPEMDVIKAGYDKVAEKFDSIIVEGSGGIVCPIRFDGGKIMLEDVIRELGLSCVIVADAGLGTINSVVLTAEYMKAHDIPVKGVIYNNCHPGNMMESDNIFMCEQLTGLRTIAKVEADAGEIDIEISELALMFR